MKKLIPLILLAVAAVFVLTSCDAILEAMFPEDTVGTGGDNPATNFLEFNITGHTYTPNGLWEKPDGTDTNGNSFIYVRVYDQQYNLVYDSTGESGGSGSAFNYNPVYFNFDYTGSNGEVTIDVPDLMDSNYSFEIWYDYDGDKNPGNESYDTYSWYYTTWDTNYNTTVSVSGGSTTDVDVDLWEW